MNTTVPDPTVYVDPYPGMKGTDHVGVDCGQCGGSGVYHGPTNAMWEYKGVMGPWCFTCGGSGQRSIKVSSARATAKRHATLARKHRDEAPIREWLAAERLHHQIVKAEAAAYAEQARRDALVGGFVGDIDTKVANLDGVVTRAIEFPAQDYYGNDTTGRRLIITLTDGKVVSWASSSAAAVWSVGEGDAVRITSAIVKKHKNFRGQDETELKNTRLKKA
ncbi:hypothetical protein [Nocardia sp. NPDC057030]|uniref:hypothetical protein n=1 Tax=unclassified Nocardia TaxID=2637762 RepID=UPI00362B8907